MTTPSLRPRFFAIRDPAAAAGSTFAYEVDSNAPLAAAGDLVVSSGGLSIAATSSLTLTDLASTPAAIPLNTALTLVNYAGSWDGGLFSYGNATLVNGGTFTPGAQQWVIRYDATSGGVNFPGEYAGANFLNITAVPEPTSAAVLGIASLAIGAIIRRRRASR